MSKKVIASFIVLTIVLLILIGMAITPSNGSYHPICFSDTAPVFYEDANITLGFGQSTVILSGNISSNFTVHHLCPDGELLVLSGNKSKTITEEGTYTTEKLAEDMNTEPPLELLHVDSSSGFISYIGQME